MPVVWWDLSFNAAVSRMHPSMIAVGSDDPSSSGGGKVQIFEYSDNTRWVTCAQSAVSV